MKQRLIRTFACISVVLISYMAYATLAVPFLEPTIQLSDVTITESAGRHAPRERGFEQLFADGSWELRQPKVLETDRGTLIFDDYETLPPLRNATNGDKDITSRMKLTRCSMIFRAGREKGEKRAVVLRAPEGAVMFFEGELNIPRGKFGRLIGGELSGEVTIYSPPTSAGNDGLEIVTSNIRIEERKIWTPHGVSFRYGPNSGQGGDLQIVMHPPTKTRKTTSSPSSVGRIQSFQLRRVDNISLQIPAGKLAVPGESRLESRDPAAVTPVDIKCRGALEFNFDEYVLSLNDHVDVLRHHADGPSDQLNCQQLQIHFQKSEPDRDDLGMVAIGPKPHKIVALGVPATLRADSLGGFVRGEQLEFNFETNRVWIHAPSGVELRSDKLHVSSTEIEYELGPGGRLGLMWAAGPGRVSGVLGKDRTPFQATWQQEVQLQEFKGSKVLSLTGGASVSVEGSGGFSANELHVFLSEQPRADNPKRMSIQPDRMKAIGDVRFDSPKLSGALEEANIWFRAEPADSKTGSALPPLVPVSSKGVRGERPTKLHVTAGTLNAELQLGDDPQVLQLAAIGQVRCETADPRSPQRVSVHCDSFELQHGDTNNPVATLIGRPARVGAKGALIVGESIQLQYGANIIEMRGPGEMTLPRTKTPQNPWRLTWQRQMRFDGQRATFDGNAKARGVQLLRGDEQLNFAAQGDSLAATLTEFIDFDNARGRDDVGLSELQFNGGAFLESEVFDPAGMRKSSERMQIRNLTFNQTTGKLHGDGPGWLTSVHDGKDLFKESEFSTTPRGLHFLRIDFERELTGDLSRRQIEFLGDVRSLYGPVSTWDQTITPTHLSQLGERDVVITSQRLAVADLGQSREQFDAIELEATGNAFVRGQTFTAAGQRISYAKLKDQLILEGDGRNDARLTFQRTPGAEPGTLNAGKILYWPQTKQVELDRFRSLEVQNLGQFRRR